MIENFAAEEECISCIRAVLPMVALTGKAISRLILLVVTLPVLATIIMAGVPKLGNMLILARKVAQAFFTSNNIEVIRISKWPRSENRTTPPSTVGYPQRPRERVGTVPEVVVSPIRTVLWAIMALLLPRLERTLICLLPEAFNRILRPPQYLLLSPRHIKQSFRLLASVDLGRSTIFRCLFDSRKILINVFGITLLWPLNLNAIGIQQDALFDDPLNESIPLFKPLRSQIPPPQGAPKPVDIT